MFGPVRGVVRGAVAWLLGWVVTLVAASIGLLESDGSIAGAARAYVDAHAVPPAATGGLLVVVVAVGVAGLRAGRSTRSGVTGRIRSFVRSVRGSELKRARAAAVAGALLAVGYAVVGLAVAAAVDATPAAALVGGLLYGLVVGVPAAVVGARY